MRSLLLTGAVATATLLGAATVLAKEGSGPFRTTLDGASEVPGPGDPDGSGTARISINPGKGRICYSITVRDIDPATAAHIHEAPEGVAGPIVVGLIAPTGGSSQACATVSSELAFEILRTPSDYYINVHNAPFPAGAVRGQLG